MKTSTEYYQTETKNDFKNTIHHDQEKFLSRIDNTLVYIDIDESYKDTVKDLIKEIGY